MQLIGYLKENNSIVTKMISKIPNISKLKFLRIVIIILLLFNAFSALGGGLMLIIDPSGQLIQLPISYLENSPFSNFLIPGILLFTLNGITSLIIAILSIKKHKYFPHLVIVQGVILAAWLSIQIIIIRTFFPPMHLTCYVVALGLIVMGGLMLREDSKAIPNKYNF
jgi:hypothetical protein